jgi:hypothetical protein
VQLARVLHQFQKITAHEDFPAAEYQKEDACFRQLIEHVLDFGGSHFAVIVVIEIAMNAALVTPIGDIDVHGQRDAQRHGFLVHFHKQAHRVSALPGFNSWMGRSETSRTPCSDSWLTNCSASRRATSGSISNSPHTRRSTISESGVFPSAACQITVATSFSVKNVESSADMIIISPPSIRAAIAVLRAM